MSNSTMDFNDDAHPDVCQNIEFRLTREYEQNPRRTDSLCILALDSAKIAAKQQFGFAQNAMKTIAFLLAVAAVSGCATMVPPDNPQGVHGMIAVKSAFAAKTTMDRFEAVVKAKGMNIFARVNHAAGAERVENLCVRPRC